MTLNIPTVTQSAASLAVATPRYLFRVWSPNSDGENSRHGFKSLGCAKRPSGPQSLASLGIEMAKQMIIHHVAWTSKKDCHSDVLISFTSSLLFAVQHAIRKINTTFLSNPDTLDNCFLTIVDTHLLKHEFQRTTSLLDYYNITDADWSVRNISFRRPQHYQEYLAEWKVDLQAEPDSSYTVNFGLLMRAGLAKLVYQLDKEYQRRQGLHESLQVFLSHTRGRRYAVATSLSFEEMTTIRQLLTCFNGKWQRLMRVWFMALSKRKVDDRALRDELSRSWNKEDDIFQGYYQEFVLDLTAVIEEQEFTKLMMLGAALAHQRQSVNTSSPPFPDLISTAVLVEQSKNIPLVKTGCESLEEIMREMEKGGH